MYRFEFAGKYDNRITKYKFWQGTHHAVLPDPGFIIDQIITCIHENPVRALIVAEAHGHLFSSARDYTGEKGFVDVETEI